MKKIVWTFGLIAGGIMSLMMIVTLPFEKQFGGHGVDHWLHHDGARLSVDLLRHPLLSRHRAAARPSALDGRWRVGALIALVASACYVATWEVISHKFMPDFAAKYEAATISAFRRAARARRRSMRGSPRRSNSP